MTWDQSMMPQVDRWIRQLTPCFFDAAGFKDHAESLRKLPPIKNHHIVAAATRIIRQAGETRADAMKDPYWHPFLQDVAFWAEALLWTAAGNNKDTCPACLLYLKRAIDTAWGKYTEH